MLWYDIGQLVLCHSLKTLQLTPRIRCQLIPDSKVHGVNTVPTWVLSAPDGPHDGPMNLALRDDMIGVSLITARVTHPTKCSMMWKITLPQLYDRVYEKTTQFVLFNLNIATPGTIIFPSFAIYIAQNSLMHLFHVWDFSVLSMLSI